MSASLGILSGVVRFGGRLVRGRPIMTPIAASLIFSVVMLLGWNLASGDCFNTNHGCSFGGATIPCSNTTFCYTAPQGIECMNGAVVVSYMNSRPPNSRTNCQTFNDLGDCTETRVDCGTPVYFTQPGCGANFSCQSMTTLQWCKGPAADAGCINSP
jgi:hypothetical protein